MLTEDRQALKEILRHDSDMNEKIAQIEQIFSRYIEWLDTQVAPIKIEPWYEYTSTDPTRTFREGDVLVHLKSVRAFGTDLRILSLRHTDDLPIKDWNFFLAMKMKYLGDTCYAVEVYPPLGEIRDTSFTYHLCEVPFPIGFEACATADDGNSRR